MIPLKDDNTTTSFPIVTASIIALNVVVFIYELTLNSVASEHFVESSAIIPYELSHFVDIAPLSIVPLPLTMLTGIFIHGGLLHLIGNMLFLWIFGDNIEDTLGKPRFILFYAASGVLASLVQIAVDPMSIVPMVGASGAVAGVLGAYFLLFPRSKVLTLVFLIFFVTTIRVPAVVFLGAWLVLQILGAGDGGNVAWYAHIGGFAIGAALVLLLRPRKERSG